MSAIDIDALSGWLAGHGIAAPITLERFSGGQSNPTYALNSASGRYVLRCKPGPAAQLLPSAHAIEREYRVQQSLATTAVPVARMIALCTDEAVIGRAFYLMSRVDGQVHWDATLPALTAEARRATYGALADVMADLHALDPDTVGLADYGPQGADYCARQIARWSRQYRASETRPIPAMDRLIDWLPAQAPTASQTRLVHGDFRLDNLIFDHQSPRPLALIDWELSTLGDPLADFAYLLLAWHTPPGPLRGLAGLDLPALGIPSQAQMIERYCARSGRELDSQALRFYLAYNLFRLAAIAQGIAKRVEAGTAASAKARETGALAAPVAELALTIAGI